ncbi:hypothetical protein ACQEU6_13325 [Spirillospora sp. CA-108201]
MHRERLGFFRALIVEISDASDLAAVITEEDGYPVLSVTRVDATRSLIVGCLYWHGVWYFTTPDIRTFARADNAPAAALAVKRAMRE